MKLQEHLPDRIVVGKRSYRVDLDFRRVLSMMEIMDRDDLMPEARDYLALRCVMKRPPKDASAAMNILRSLLFDRGRRKARSGDEGSRPKLTDFVQDAALIRSAFRQVYGIDLYRDRLHWLEFTELLHGLPEGNRYTEVIGIRAKPMPVPTKYNEAERQNLAQAKRLYALELDDQESAVQIDRALTSLASVLISLSDKKGGETQ